LKEYDMAEWFPNSRAEIITMCLNWTNYMTTARRTAWGIPAADFTALGTEFDAARTILQKANDETQRTPVITAQCKTAFETLAARMRFFHKHYLLMPPLTLADYLAMGFRQPGETSTPIPPPAAEGEADLAFPDYHLIDVLRIRRRGAPGDLRSYHGAHIHIGIVDGTGPWRIAAPPAAAADLPWSMFTRRRRERFDFAGNSGKTVYVAIVWTNEKGNLGPAGPVISGVIP
jgi:hypothetical protein